MNPSREKEKVERSHREWPPILCDVVLPYSENILHINLFCSVLPFHHLSTKLQRSWCKEVRNDVHSVQIPHGCFYFKSHRPAMPLGCQWPVTKPESSSSPQPWPIVG